MSWCDSESNLLLRAACKMGALLEGGSLTGPWATGDGGLAVGAYQEHPSYGTAATRSNPTTAWAAIRPRYLSCLTRGDNSAVGLARIVACAEVPQLYLNGNSEGYTSDRIQSAWSTLMGQSGTTSTTATSASNPIPGVDGIVSALNGVQSSVTGIGQSLGNLSLLGSIARIAFGAFSSPDLWISVILLVMGMGITFVSVSALVARSAPARAVTGAVMTAAT